MPYNIYMVRKWENENSTIGQISVEGADSKKKELTNGFILERPGPDSTTSGLRLRIPEGIYNLKWATTTNNPRIASQLPLPWIYGSSVSANRGIYIHHGNGPSNTDGCLLIGLGYGKNMVTSSVDALTRLKTFLNRVGIENVRINISSNYIST